MNALEYNLPLTTSDILLTDIMEFADDDETNGHDDQLMDIVHANQPWKPLRPHIMPLLLNHIIHIKRFANQTIVSGPLLKFDYDRNGYGYIIVMDNAPNANYRHTIYTALIESVYIDYTPTTQQSLQVVSDELLLARLNGDVVGEISSYLQSDYLYL